MYLCLCEGVTDKEWVQALAKYENDWERASLETGAGQNCGSCRALLEEYAMAKTLDLPVLQVA